MSRNFVPKFRAYFLVNIDQRWGYFYSPGHRKTETHGFTGIVVRILTQNNHLYPIEGRFIESIENQGARRINLVTGRHGFHKEFFDAGKIRRSKFSSECQLPALFYLYVWCLFHQLLNKFEVFLKKSAAIFSQNHITLTLQPKKPVILRRRSRSSVDRASAF